MRKNNLDLKEIGGRLKEARKAIEKTQREIAKLAGIAKSVISEMETGQRRPHAKYLLLLVSEFKINLNWIFTGEGSMFADYEISWNFGKDNETLKEMLYLIDHYPKFRVLIFQFFIDFKEDNKDSIKKILSKMKKEKPSDR